MSSSELTCRVLINADSLLTGQKATASRSAGRVTRVTLEYRGGRALRSTTMPGVNGLK